VCSKCSHRLLCSCTAWRASSTACAPLFALRYECPHALGRETSMPLDDCCKVISQGESIFRYCLLNGPHLFCCRECAEVQRSRSKEASGSPRQPFHPSEPVVTASTQHICRYASFQDCYIVCAWLRERPANVSTSPCSITGPSRTPAPRTKPDHRLPDFMQC
jgi:hypothetical protein